MLHLLCLHSLGNFILNHSNKSSKLSNAVWFQQLATLILMPMLIIKTCGTTQLLKFILPLMYYAYHHLGLTLCSCCYTRGSFIFPKSKPILTLGFRNKQECMGASRINKPNVSAEQGALNGCCVFSR